LQFASELFQKIRGFRALLGREGVSRYYLVSLKTGFDRDYRIALGLDRPSRQPSQLSGGDPDERGDFQQLFGHQRPCSCLGQWETSTESIYRARQWPGFAKSKSARVKRMANETAKRK
jgi:hypothetical protein